VTMLQRRMSLCVILCRSIIDRLGEGAFFGRVVKELLVHFKKHIEKEKR
jgi:hypothetical protein